jgi:hypothetical protein
MQAPHVHALLIERIVGEGRANADLDVFCRAPTGTLLLKPITDDTRSVDDAQ